MLKLKYSVKGRSVTISSKTYTYLSYEMEDSGYERLVFLLLPLTS